VVGVGCGETRRRRSGTQPPEADRVANEHMSQVTAHKTTHAPQTVASAMAWAYERVMGHRPPTTTSWLYPMAQSAIETAHWTQCYNHNAGNVTTANPNHDSWMFEPGNGLKFRSFSTIGDGCLVLMKWLAAHGTLSYADAGNKAGFLASLKAGCYAGCGVDYPDIGAYVTAYQSIKPGFYLNVPPWGYYAIGAAVLIGTGATAYYMAEGELPTPRRVIAAI
jgi:hypothetical protein